MQKLSRCDLLLYATNYNISISKMTIICSWAWEESIESARFSAVLFILHYIFLFLSAFCHTHTYTNSTDNADDNNGYNNYNNANNDNDNNNNLTNNNYILICTLQMKVKIYTNHSVIPQSFLLWNETCMLSCRLSHPTGERDGWIFTLP